MSIYVFIIEDNIRHFADNLILARLEAEEEEGSVALESLTETHLLQTLADIYLGIFLRFSRHHWIF